MNYFWLVRVAFATDEIRHDRIDVQIGHDFIADAARCYLAGPTNSAGVRMPPRIVWCNRAYSRYWKSVILQKTPTVEFEAIPRGIRAQ